MKRDLAFEAGGQAPEAALLSEEIAANVITVIQHYHDRWEGYSYGVKRGMPLEEVVLRHNRGYDAHASEVLFPNEAIKVSHSGDFPLFVRQRIIINQDGQPVDRRDSFWTRRQLKKTGIEPKPSLSAERYS